MPRTTKETAVESIQKESAKKVATKKSTSSKKQTVITTKSKQSSAAKKKAEVKKETSRKPKQAVSTTKGKKQSTKKVVTPVIEYYDLPYRYNQTLVKILAQTPNTLFVYWDISNEDRLAFENQYGKDFFLTTKPVLIIRNETMEYEFELEINDFANSWYIQVKDANCKYHIELGRRPRLLNTSLSQDYIFVSSSNKLNAPNDHVLFEKFNPSVVYRNIKSNQTTVKDFSHLETIQNIEHVHTLHDLYQNLYEKELLEEIDSLLKNPSSGASSSFK